jgi:hypothetical protein
VCGVILRQLLASASLTGAHTPIRLQEGEWVRFSAKDPLNSAFLHGGVLHRTHTVDCPANHPPRTPSPIGIPKRPIGYGWKALLVAILSKGIL